MPSKIKQKSRELARGGTAPLEKDTTSTEDQRSNQLRNFILVGPEAAT